MGEYDWSKLSPEQEAQFRSEVDGWISRGWLVEHDSSCHEEPVSVLPLLAKVQSHKSSTPVRPCLDYRALNKCIVSHPGGEAPACDERLRAWRQAGPASNFQLLDISKAYLQVRVRPSLLKHQTVLWNGQVYVMERMGFGLSVAPKILDAIVKWVVRNFEGVDNYVDDLRVPDELLEPVARELAKYGLDTKPAEKFTEARVLGLQLEQRTGETCWRRRDGCDMKLPAIPTKRDIFKWCGRLVGHYPVCSWLRPACSYLKRLSSEGNTEWDQSVSLEVAEACHSLVERVSRQDPVHGVWQPDSSDPWIVWCDASDVAIGVALQAGDSIVEDAAWLRETDDRRHINVVELDAAIKGLSLAVDWQVTDLQLMTDSKTVAGWLKYIADNTRRVRVSGFKEVLVQRHLQIVNPLPASH